MSVARTEEEIKVEVVLPWLNKLGFDPASLYLETSFTLHVGRHVLQSPKKNPGWVGSRLDILAQDGKGGRNLFIIETKEEDHALTNDDAEQAISYARLVTPIAPFAIVTNGKEWRIYDVLTKHEISHSKLSPNSSFEVSLPDDAIADATEHLLGLSEHNLRLFCEAQRAHSLSPLIGSRSDLAKKFIPELHVPNPELEEAFASFMSSSSVCFAIVGQSGLGKTCEMCFLDQRSAAQGIPTLFYQGLLLESGMATGIAADFNWTFSEQQTEIQLLKRLKRLLRKRQLVVFVDAIDEWTFGAKVQNLVSLLKQLQGGPIKLVLSCKQLSWGQFTAIKGTDTGVRSFVFSRSGGQDSHEKGSHELVGFDDERFSKAIAQYKKVFEIDAHLEPAVLAEGKRNPFLLRVFFSVAHSHKLTELTFSSSDFFNEYYTLMLEKTGDAERCSRQLALVAIALYRRNQDWISLDILGRDIGLGASDVLVPALFETNLLAKSADHPPKVGFYFQQLRDFIIFKTLQWDVLPIPDFKAAMSNVGVDGVQAEALTLFYRHASDDRKRVLDGDPRINAEKYLNAYTEFATKHFPVLANSISGKAGTSIGFFGQFDVANRKIEGYGVRPIQGKEPRVELVTSGSVSLRHVFDDYGVRKLRWSPEMNGFKHFPGKLFALAEAVADVKDLIKSRRLIESDCRCLTKENLVRLLVSKTLIFKDLLEKPPALPQTSRLRRLRLPLALATIAELARRFHLQVHFRDEIIAKRRAAKDASGPIEPFAGLSFSGDEKKEVDRLVDAAFAQQSRVGTESHLVELETTIQQYIDDLAPNTELDRIWVERNDIIEALRSDPVLGIRLLRDHSQNLLTRFLEEYPKLVDANFSGIAKATFRSRWPLSVVLSIDETHILKAIRHDFYSEGSSGIYFGSFDAGEPRILICRPDEMSTTFPDYTVAGANFRAVRASGFPVFRYLFSTENDYSSLGRPVCTLPLHDFIYEFVHEDFDNAQRSSRAGQFGRGSSSAEAERA